MDRPYPPSEEAILEVFLAWLNARDGARYEMKSRPDQDPARGRSPACDFICEDLQTGRRVAVEVTTLWREEGAGDQDRGWAAWRVEVERMVAGKLPGTFHLATPIAILDGSDPGRAAADLRSAVADRTWDGADGRLVDVVIDGVRCRLSRFDAAGSKVEFLRLAPEDPVADAQAFLIRIAEKKRTQLQKWAKLGVATYLVAYNTAWPLFSQPDQRTIANTVLENGNGLIDCVVIVSGNPPDDASCDGYYQSGREELPRAPNS